MSDQLRTRRDRSPAEDRGRRWLLILGCALYAAGLDFLYVHDLRPWSYLGYVLGDRPAYLAITGFMLALLPALWLPLGITKPSQALYWVIYLLVLVPIMLVGSRTSAQPPAEVFLLLTTIFIAFVGLYGFSLLRAIPMVRLRLGTPLWVFLGIFSAAFYMYLSTRFQLRLQIGSLIDVYGTRADYRQELGQGAIPIAYFVNTFGYVINPLFIGRGLLSKNPLLIGAGVAGQLLIFSFTGSKTVLLIGLLIAGIFIALSRRVRFNGTLIVWGMIAGLLLTALIGRLTASVIPVSLFVRRLLATSGLNTARYFDFFSANPKAQLGHSVLSPLVDYPYDLTPPLLVGNAYSGDGFFSANANFWADAFANFGYWGIPTFTLILGLFVWAFDSASANQDLRITSLMLVAPGFALVNSALFTSFATHGLLVALLLVLLTPTSTLRTATTPNRMPTPLFARRALSH